MFFLVTFIVIQSSPIIQFSDIEFYNSFSLADSTNNSNREIDKINLFKLGVPPFRENAPNNINVQPSPVNLILLSASPNQITDDEAWLERNNLSLPTYEVPNPFRQTLGKIPDYIPKTFNNNMLVKAIRGEQQDYLVYGRNFAENKYLLIYDRDAKKFTQSYDFSNYIYASNYLPGERDYINQTLNWVITEDNILYFSHSHSTYAKSSSGMNAYLTALDLKTNQILWRSQPLVCNASNFIIIDDVIICGYGFTAELDYLYLINKNTGEILQQIPLKTAPDYIIPKDNKLYVRTYNTDYVFKIQD
ncbi:MAG: hypothetical protein Tsb0014_38150 [Pleurocapsa sp.]